MLYQQSIEEACNLTDHDFIQTSEGRILPYAPTYDQLNISIRDGQAEQHPSHLRIEELKEKAMSETGCEHVEDLLEDEIFQEETGNGEHIDSNILYQDIPTCAIISDEVKVRALDELKFDVFISHAREDRNWVVDILNKLESPEHGFKCCFADRDFELGRSVFDNITRSIQASAKTVIVLSPEFIDSDWCEFEIRMTLEADLSARKRILIPVMLRQCRVPDFIGRLTYIEVENEHFWERFISALYSRDIESDMTQTGNQSNRYRVTSLQLPFHRNLDKLVKIDVSDIHCCCCCCGSESSCRIVPNEIAETIIAEDFQKIIGIFKQQPYVKCRSLFTCAFWTVVVVESIWVVGIMILILISIERVDESLPTSLVLILPTLLILCIFASIRLACGCHSAKNFNRAIRRANEISLRYNLMVGYEKFGCFNACFWSKLNIIFNFYDWRLCLAHFREHQRYDAEWNRNSDLSDINTDEIHPIASNGPTEDFAEESLMAYIPEYLELFVKKKLKQPTEERHVRHCECLCQFAESLKAQNETRLVCVFGVKSRRPFKRIAEFLI